MKTKEKVEWLREYMAALELQGKILIRKDKDGILERPSEIVRVAMKFLESGLRSRAASKRATLRVIK